MAWYVDTSAFLKLLILEAESSAMRNWFAEHESFWSSQLLHTEAVRACVRLGVERDIVESAIEAISMILPSAATFSVAARLAPGTLRSLDAIHLATAMEMGGDLEGIATYDDRLAEAARLVGIKPIVPV